MVLRNQDEESLAGLGIVRMSEIVVECCKSAGVAVAFTSSQIVVECCKSAGVALAFTSSQIVVVL